MRTCALFLLGAWMCCVACTSEQNSKVNINVVRADSLLNQVLALYEVKEWVIAGELSSERKRTSDLSGR